MSSTTDQIKNDKTNPIFPEGQSMIEMGVG